MKLPANITIGKTEYTIEFIKKSDPRYEEIFFYDGKMHCAIWQWSNKRMYILEDYWDLVQEDEKIRIIIHELMHAFFFELLYDDILIEHLTKIIIPIVQGVKYGN